MPDGDILTEQQIYEFREGESMDLDDDNVCDSHERLRVRLAEAGLERDKADHAANTATSRARDAEVERLNTQARLADAQAALEEMRTLVVEATALGLEERAEEKGDRELVKWASVLRSRARAALASSGAASGKERPDRRTDEEKALARTAYLSAPWASGKERATVCEECGSGLLNGEHIADYPCSRRDSGKGRTLSEEEKDRVIEAFRFTIAALENFRQAYKESYYAEEAVECLVEFSHPALALLEGERHDG